MTCSEEANTKVHYELIGEFVAKVNSIEFIVNILLEKIIEQYSSTLSIEDAAEYTIDHIEQQSLKIRINLIIVLLTMTNSDKEVVKGAVERLKDFARYYNKTIRDIRDFIAHNPYMKGGDYLIVSSRRYKGKLNSLKIDDLKAHIKTLIPFITDLFKVVEELSDLYPKKIVRELS
jgi:hypothetical protein